MDGHSGTPRDSVQFSLWQNTHHGERIVVLSVNADRLQSRPFIAPDHQAIGACRQILRDVEIEAILSQFPSLPPGRRMAFFQKRMIILGDETPTCIP
jgi:hypothetical protein